MKAKINCILLVDDDNTVNFLHEAIIEKEALSNTLEVVETGEQALEFLNRPLSEGQKSPELIFLDLNMPKMDGWEFLEEYRKLQRTRQDSSIIILTSSANTDDRKRAETNDLVRGYYTKPLTGELFREIVNRYLGE